MNLLSDSRKRVDTDGINSLRYETKAFEELPLYTRILAHIDENTVMVSRFLLIRLCVRERRQTGLKMWGGQQADPLKGGASSGVQRPLVSVSSSLKQKAF